MKKNNFSRRFFLLWNAHIILESLPISSSTHVDILNNALARIYKQPKIAINTVTNYLMHIPTALIILFFLAIYCIPVAKQASLTDVTWWFIAAIIADACTGLCYFIFKEERIKKWPAWLGLLISACLLFSLYFVHDKTTWYSELGQWKNITIMQAVIIGIMQGISLLPGISRLASTVIPGIWLGLDPVTSVFFSLTSEFGLLLAAFLKASYLLFKQREKALIPKFSVINISMLVTSMIVSFILLHLMFAIFFRPDGFVIAGVYLLLIALLLAFIKQKDYSI